MEEIFTEKRKLRGGYRYLEYLVTLDEIDLVEELRDAVADLEDLLPIAQGWTNCSVMDMWSDIYNNIEDACVQFGYTIGELSR